MGESNPEKPSVSIIEIHATSIFIRAATAIRNSILEMHKLREEMTLLRNEVATSREQLQESVVRLQRELSKGQRIDSNSFTESKRLLVH
jgi:hypothetical protein